MKKAALDRLFSSVREAGRIHRGEVEPSGARAFSPEAVKSTRKGFGKSQPEFARMIGVSVATLRSWEQGRRVPEGPALALLRVAAKEPKAVERALR
jgi:putative transcriptional regulator